MTPDATQIPVTDLTPGMRLAASVQDRQGRILLAAGATLSTAAIESLKRHGFEEVSVETEIRPEIRPEMRDPEADRKTRARLVHLFRNVSPSPAAAMLLTELMRYRGVDGDD